MKSILSVWPICFDVSVRVIMFSASCQSPDTFFELTDIDFEIEFVFVFVRLRCENINVKISE